MVVPNIKAGRIIKTLRRMSGISQEQLSGKMGVSKDYLHILESNQAEPTSQDINAIIDATGTSISAYESLVETEQYLDYIGTLPHEEHIFKTDNLVKKENIIRILKRYFVNSKVQKAYLVGSYSRDEQTEESDVDLLIQFDETKNPTLFDIIEIKYELQKLLHKTVDVVQQGSEYDHIRESMNRDKILVYG